MHNSKLLKLFQAMRPKERKELGEYIRLSFVQSNPSVIALYTYLYEHYNAEVGEKLERKTVYRQLFNMPYNDGRMRTLMLQLTRLIEEYATLKTLRKQPDHYSILLADALRAYQLDKLLFKHIESTQKKLDQAPPKDLRYHYHHLQGQRLLYLHPNYQKTRQQIDAITSHADYFWLLIRLRSIVEARIWQLLRGVATKIPFEKATLRLAKHPAFQAHPLVSIYYQAIQLLNRRQSNTLAYAALKDEVISHFHLADPDERINLFALLINVAYCSLSSTAYIHEGFHLYQEAVERNWLIENGYISADHFHNVVDAACGVGDFEWAEAFIQRSTRLLDTRRDKQRDVKKLFRARIAFRKQDYEKVIRRLEPIAFRDFSYESRRYTLLIRSYYQQYTQLETTVDLQSMDDALDALEESNKAYRFYLHKQYQTQTLSETLYQAHLQFTNFLKRLPFCRDSRFAQITPAQLQEQLKESTNVACATWLHQAINHRRKSAN